MMEHSTVGGQTKTIVESIVTSALSPEDVLQHLDSYGIDWYLTQKGDLMICYWQVAAEDFVPKEQVATIRENQTVPPDASSLEWLSSRLSEIKGQYANCWIAIKDHKVVASAGNLTDLLQSVRDAQIESPFVTFIPSDPIVWATAYGNKNF
jgi:Family of unknown function (DUF5678)